MKSKHVSINVFVFMELIFSWNEVTGNNQMVRSAMQGEEARKGIGGAGVAVLGRASKKVTLERHE